MARTTQIRVGCRIRLGPPTAESCLRRSSPQIQSKRRRRFSCSTFIPGVPFTSLTMTSSTDSTKIATVSDVLEAVNGAFRSGSWTSVSDDKGSYSPSAAPPTTLLMHDRRKRSSCNDFHQKKPVLVLKRPISNILAEVKSQKRRKVETATTKMTRPPSNRDLRSPTLSKAYASMNGMNMMTTIDRPVLFPVEQSLVSSTAAMDDHKMGCTSAASSGSWQAQSPKKRPFRCCIKRKIVVDEPQQTCSPCLISVSPSCLR